MGLFGSLIGQGLGALGGGLFGNQELGRSIGGQIGQNVLPFARGAVVRPSPLYTGGLIQPVSAYAIQASGGRRAKKKGGKRKK
jgi:hypothetical protein